MESKSESRPVPPSPVQFRQGPPQLRNHLPPQAHKSSCLRKSCLSCSYLHPSCLCLLISCLNPAYPDPTYMLLISNLNPAYPAYMLCISSQSPAYPAYVHAAYIQPKFCLSCLHAAYTYPTKILLIPPTCCLYRT